MGSFSIWHWLIVLLVLAFPAIVVATERSGKRASRSIFALGLGVVLFYACLPDVLWLFFDVQIGNLIGLIWLVGIALTVWFYRLIVQRARDAGHSKIIAYLACVPAVNLFVYIYLLFPGGKADVPTIRAFE
jgi:uncharacterized membrane protein YhaH (DUF805 family)